jgi:hypothetical protein
MLSYIHLTLSKDKAHSTLVTSFRLPEFLCAITYRIVSKQSVVVTKDSLLRIVVR